MKIKCVIVEDVPEAVHLLQIYCEKAGDLEVVASFMSGEEFLAEKDTLEFDACFMDIMMSGISGMACAQLLEDKAVIFVSGNTNRAFEGYGIDAVDFVPKPVQKDRFMQAVERLRKRLATQSKADYAWFNTDKGRYKLVFDAVLMVSTDGSVASDPRDKVVILDNGKRLTLKNQSLSHLADVLPGKKFVQINRTTLICVDIFLSLRDHNTILVKLPDVERPGRWKEEPLDLGETYHQVFCEKIDLK